MGPDNGVNSPIPRASSHQGVFLRRTDTLLVTSLARSATAPLFTRSETDPDSGIMINYSYGPAKVLLVFVPVGIAAGVCDLPGLAIFILNFLALVSLAPFITFTVLGLSDGVGVSGGLLRAIFGNSTELIVSVALPPSPRSTTMAI